MTRTKTVFIASVAALLAGVVAAKATNTVFFTSIGDLVFPFGVPTDRGINGTIGDVNSGGMAPVNGNLSYTKRGATVGTGFSYTFANWQRNMLFAPSGTLASGYVTLAPAPIDGGEACVFSTQIVTAFYIAANAGQTINNAATALTANGSVCYTYSKANTTWDRSR